MSLVLNISQICAKVRKNEYVFAQLYESHYDKIPDKQPFDTLHGADCEDLIEQLKEFAGNYPGAFTGVFKASKESQKRHVVKLKFSAAGVPSVAPGVNVEAMRSEILESVRAEVKQELEVERLKRELEESKKELANFQMNGGKLAYALEQFFNRYIMSKKETQLQGFDNLSENEVEQIEEAFAILLEALGYEIIVKLAAKFEAGEADSIVPMVQNFANS